MKMFSAGVCNRFRQVSLLDPQDKEAGFFKVEKNEPFAKPG